MNDRHDPMLLWEMGKLFLACLNRTLKTFWDRLSLFLSFFCLSFLATSMRDAGKCDG